MMTAQMGTLKSKISSQEAKAAADTTAAAEASEGASVELNKQITDALAEAQSESDQKFSKLYTDMSEQRAEIDKNLGAAITSMNDGIAKQAALADSRFSKTVKDIA